jgi:hypothetical protein
MVGLGFVINLIKKLRALNVVKFYYTASLALPLALLLAITFLPFFVAILALNPCVLFLETLLG